jgi:uncharacterized protein YdhG (YjbR/CyaY superfamily)
VVSKSVDKHYKVAPSPHRETMLEMRKRIMQIVPKAEEVVSYGMPAFKVDGNIVAGLLANKNHVGYYPFSGSVLHLFKKELANFTQTKSAIHVPIDKPLSKSLLIKLIKARISQCPVKQGKVNLAKYEKLDGDWKAIGIAAPARRALVDAKLLKIADLKNISERKLNGLHGIGPNALKILKTEMKRRKISFAKN